MTDNISKDSPTLAISQEAPQGKTEEPPNLVTPPASQQTFFPSVACSTTQTHSAVFLAVSTSLAEVAAMLSL